LKRSHDSEHHLAPSLYTATHSFSLRERDFTTGLPKTAALRKVHPHDPRTAAQYLVLGGKCHSWKRGPAMDGNCTATTLPVEWDEMEKALATRLEITRRRLHRCR